MTPKKVDLQHLVWLLIEGGLVPTERTERGSYLYTCPEDTSVLILGALIDDRYAPVEKGPKRLQQGDTFEVAADDVLQAVQNIKPFERDDETGLQLVHVHEDSLDVVPDPASVLTIVPPAVLLDGTPETSVGWNERTYCRIAFRSNRDLSYERDLVVQTRAGRFLLAGCRPAGLGEVTKFPIRFKRVFPLDDSAESAMNA